MIQFKAIEVNPPVNDTFCCNCGENPVDNRCSGYWSNSIDYGREFDCETPLPGVTCEDCPFVWCVECKKVLIYELGFSHARRR